MRRTGRRGINEGIDGTLWDRKAIGATSDGHLW